MTAASIPLRGPTSLRRRVERELDDDIKGFSSGLDRPPFVNDQYGAAILVVWLAPIFQRQIEGARLAAPLAA